MKFYKISEETKNAFLAYLGTKPYNEVFQGMDALSKLELIEEKPTDNQS